METLPILKGIFPHHAENNDENDVIVTKRALDRLGYHHSGKAGPTCFPDQEFFDGIRKFQKDQGLKIDGIVTVGGLTARVIGSLLEGMAPFIGLPAGSAKPTAAQCDHLHYNVDIPICNAISRERGKQRGVECRKSAMERYSRCLAGTPIADLPPLNTWNN